MIEPSGETILPETMQGDAVPFDNPIVREARIRFSRCGEWEAAWRPRFIDDIKFENGDSDNGYQWPNEVRRNREIDSRPCLTMNVVRQHNLQISNEMRKNKSSITVVAMGDAGTAEAASIWSDIIRHVETVSDAQSAYTVARGFQIGGGLGWWRIVTEYESPTSFNQNPRIIPVMDPLSIYMDPDTQTLNGRDANFAFVFDDVPREQFEAAYPELSDQVGQMPMDLGGQEDWLSKDHVRVCEYFRKVAVSDRVVSFVWQGERKTLLKSQCPDNIWEELIAKKDSRTRSTQTYRIEWYLIAGDKVVDSTVWPGSFIPLIRVIGEQSVMQGILDRWGHTRKLKDAQRMFNYNASAQVELVALQGKTPWLAPAKAIEELESMWNTANTVNHSVLVWNHVDDDNPDKDIPPPQRIPPPNFSPAFQTGMDTAFNQMMMTSGQWQNQMGMMGNERTGAAIGKRMEQGDTATFHFQDNYEMALRFTGEQLIDLIPKLWDTRRVLTILSKSGETLRLVIDPMAKQALAKELAADGAVIAQVLNPNIGLYAIAPSVGPAYGSRREEVVEKLGVLLAEAPTLVPVIGDLLVGAMDFEGAQEAAMRLRRLVPPQALGEGPTQNEQVLGAKSAALQNALAEALQHNAKSELKLVGKEQMRDIDAYEAETKRLVGLKEELPTDGAGLKTLIEGLVRDAISNSLSPIFAANANNIDIDSSPVAGARRGNDGEWYLADPSRPGKHLKVGRAQSGQA